MGPEELLLRPRERVERALLDAERLGDVAHRRPVEAALREAGLRCPDDIAVVSFDGTSESEYCWPPLTVARQPIQAMAEAAVSMVLNLGSPSTAYQRFATELVIRESCGCQEPAATS